MRSVTGCNFDRDHEIMECFAECIESCAPERNDQYRIRSMAWLGWARRVDGLPDAGLAKRSLALARRSGDPWTIAFALVQAHRMLSDRCRPPNTDLTEASRALEEAIALARLTGDPFILCQALCAKGELLLVDRQWAEAEARHRESFAIARAGDDLHSIVMAVFGLTGVLHGTGRPLETKELYLRTLRRAADAGTRSFYGCLFGGLCWVAIAEGRPVRAARLWGASMAACAPAEGMPQELPSRLALEEEVGMAEWQRGRSMSIAEAVEYAFSDA